MKRKVITDRSVGNNNSLRIVRRMGFKAVKLVSDAKSPALFHVTKRDSNTSRVKSHRECAAAVACKREYELDGVIISRSTAYFIKGNEAVRYKLPETVSREVVSFDRKAGFAEGEYMLVPPCPSSRLGARQERGLKPNPHKTGGDGSHRFHHDTTDMRHSLKEV